MEHGIAAARRCTPLAPVFLADSARGIAPFVPVCHPSAATVVGNALQR